jgi:hypothetical protein
MYFWMMKLRHRGCWVLVVLLVVGMWGLAVEAEISGYGALEEGF